MNINNSAAFLIEIKEKFYPLFFNTIVNSPFERVKILLAIISGRILFPIPLGFFSLNPYYFHCEQILT